MLTVCGLGIALMLFTFRHERVRWSDVSPITLFLCQSGEYATALLFYGRRDDFDIGGSNGFAFVGFWAVSIPFFFLARVESQQRIAQPPWPIKFLCIAGLLTGITAFPRLTLMIRFSYWVPQIWYAAEANCRRSMSLPFALGINGGQMLFTAALVKYHPMFEGSWAGIVSPAIVWSVLQIVVIILQNCCGSAFFMPKESRKQRFDWRAERPDPETECPVCLDTIGADQTFLRTPCGHVFHDRCLRTWTDEHPDCPVCRHVLPSIDVDPTDP
jgi:hypothetical protein